MFKKKKYELVQGPKLLWGSDSILKGSSSKTVLDGKEGMLMETNCTKKLCLDKSDACTS